jgi:peroxiredoxin Q/BCP
MPSKKKSTKKIPARKKTTAKKSVSKAKPRKRATKKPASRTLKKTAPKKAATPGKTKTGGVAVGKPAPSLRLPATNGHTIDLAELKGQPVVLYFYPKDSTPGCTIEGRDFRDRHAEFTRLQAIVLGISRDSLKSHERFRSKENFPFDLLSDAEEKACQLFDVIKPKNMYGKMVRGIERSTFLIDRQGILRREWRKVKIEGHADEVLAAVKVL